MSQPIDHHLIDQLVTSIFVINEDFTICYANAAAEQLFKQSQKKMVGLLLTDLYYQLSSQQQLFQKALTKEQGFTDNLATLVLLDRHEIIIDLCTSPIIWQQQPALLLEIRQVDQQQRISSEMQQLTQQQLAKDLVRGLAHEIKNPLGGLRGAAQLLHRQLSDESKEYTQMIMEQADRLNSLVDRLLGPNKHQPHMAHNIHQIIEKILQLVNIGLAPDIKITRDYDPSIPDIIIDPDQIQQALLNIIQNAIQAVKKQGKITILTRIANQVTLNGIRHKMAIEIKIIDNGPGIPDDLKQTLFYPMVSGRAEGTGLGLSIAQTLIQQHQGRIDVISHPEATEFTVTIPVQTL